VSWISDKGFAHCAVDDPMGTGVSFPGGKVAGSWLSLTSIYWRSQRM